MEKQTRLQDPENRENMLCSMVIWRQHDGYCYKLTATTAAIKCAANEKERDMVVVRRIPGNKRRVRSNERETGRVKGSE